MIQTGDEFYVNKLLAKTDTNFHKPSIAVKNSTLMKMHKFSYYNRPEKSSNMSFQTYQKENPK